MKHLEDTMIWSYCKDENTLLSCQVAEVVERLATVCGG